MSVRDRFVQDGHRFYFPDGAPAGRSVSAAAATVGTERVWSLRIHLTSDVVQTRRKKSTTFDVRSVVIHGRASAIDRDDACIDKRRLVRGEEDRGHGHLFRPT